MLVEVDSQCLILDIIVGGEKMSLFKENTLSCYLEENTLSCYLDICIYMAYTKTVQCFFKLKIKSIKTETLYHISLLNI